ncbi:ABC transporter permease [Haloarculaceae archaeon H-GB2-1]|nr:ABC transporter permease [Haloarculaceae archaeon H-GB1-1]MEA5387890.1 ABC transporter permease [Haloarculaceae archaeon H-GB11]MEA5409383.1 ABC transporter permease [Haloarculaceae archaeon H-GB2-1]
MSTEDTTTVGSFQLPSIVPRLLSNRKILVGLTVLLPIIVITALGESITPYDPLQTHVADKYAAPGGQYLLGTDNLGRDILSRLITGGQSSLLLGFGATAVSMSAGVPIGLSAGYLKGRVDEVLMRLMDIMMSVPVLLLGILILVALSSNIVNVILAIGIVYVPRIARVTRSATLAVSEEPYVMAAKARGESTSHILFKEIMPNVMAPIVVEGSIRVGYAIMIGTSLSFLGLGAGPPHADWGYMIATARLHIYQTPWFLLWPSLALLVTIMAINILGDGLRDVLDPRAMEGEL